MDRIHATERLTPIDGQTVLDIFHVWPDGHVENGVIHRSWLFVYLADPPEDPSAKVDVTLWLPGRGAETRPLGWGEEWYTDVPAWGVASVTAVDDYPLEFFWELTPGKA